MGYVRVSKSRQALAAQEAELRAADCAIKVLRKRCPTLRPSGKQHVTVKHIHQQMNVTEGRQARQGNEHGHEMQGSDGGGMIESEPERVRARLEALVRANAAPRCGARSKRTGMLCMQGHGGKSTGPRPPRGLERSELEARLLFA